MSIPAEGLCTLEVNVGTWQKFHDKRYFVLSNFVLMRFNCVVVVVVVVLLLLMLYCFHTCLFCSFRISFVLVKTNTWPYPFLNKMSPPMISVFFAGCFVLNLLIFFSGQVLSRIRFGGENI